MWENTVITNAGIELLKNALSGGTITVTAIKSGAGKVDVSALKSQTAVSSIKQSGTVQGVTKTNETIKIGVLFSNAGLSAGYSMTQLGIYAKGSTGSEVLFAISQSTTGKEVPAESAMPSWSLVHNFYIKLNNDVKMTATVDPEGYVTFETMQTALNTHTGNKSNPHSVTKSQVGLGNVPNVATNDQTPTYSDTTTLVTLSSGEKISIAFAKIKLAITTLINHLANKSNPHGVTKSQVGLGNVENKSSATIRGELTKGNVTTALGFTPANQTDMTNAQDAITQLNSDKTWKRIFNGKLSEEFTVPSQYKEIVIQITIAYQGASDITLPEIYINDLGPWWNKITSYRYNDAYNACILMNYNNGSRKIKMNETWFVCNPSSDNISYIVYGKE